MIERPLMTADELKSLPKGRFVVMKTGAHPMKMHLRLYSELGIRFDEEHPYMAPNHANREVLYASKDELIRAICLAHNRPLPGAEVVEAEEPRVSRPSKLRSEAPATEPKTTEDKAEKEESSVASDETTGSEENAPVSEDTPTTQEPTTETEKGDTNE